MRKRIFSIILCAALLFTARPFTFKAQAVDVANLVQNIGQYIVSIPDTIADMGQLALEVSKDVANVISSQAILFQKILALMAVQTSVQTLIGSGDGLIIRDYNQYLYLTPHQRAMTQMTSFFNSVSRGRLSSLNYEGIGPNYDAYLVAQARQSILGQPFATNMQQQVSDPEKMFSGGNMKGIMTFFECANNPYCYTLVAQSKYNATVSKIQDIARSEQQGGFTPQKNSSGRITSPALLAQSAFTQLDEMGTKLIMDASVDTDAKASAAAIEQIWTGAGISTASRLINYGISDDAGREAIRNKNDEFPFSLAYNSNGGIGISAGGVNISTGLGSWGTTGCRTIGNTNACMGIDVNAQGGKVTTSTQKTSN